MEHDELNAVTEKKSEATEHIEYDRKKKKKKNLNGRVAIPDHLARHEIILDLSPEEKICPVTLGRENFLFVGSERGGETTAIFMSLIASCKANKINPYEYLKDILRRINDHPHKRLAELLPQNWQACQK